jgi:hypothetical protein
MTCSCAETVPPDDDPQAKKKKPKPVITIEKQVPVQFFEWVRSEVAKRWEGLLTNGEEWLQTHCAISDTERMAQFMSNRALRAAWAADGLLPTMMI